MLPTDAVFLDAFYAQCVASQLGLPDLIDLQRARTHWNNTLDAFLAPKDTDGDPVGPPIMLDENLNHYPMFYIQPAPGRFVPEIATCGPAPPGWRQRPPCTSAARPATGSSSPRPSR